MKIRTYILILALCFSGCTNSLKGQLNDTGSLKVSYYNSRFVAKYKDFFEFNYHSIAPRRVRQRRKKHKKGRRGKGIRPKVDNTTYKIVHRELLELQW